MEPLRFVATRKENTDSPIEILGATEKGTIRPITLTPMEALTVIRDLAGYLKTRTREEDVRGR